jgi:hypothetical protein
MKARFGNRGLLRGVMVGMGNKERGLKRLEGNFVRFFLVSLRRSFIHIRPCVPSATQLGVYEMVAPFYPVAYY